MRPPQYTLDHVWFAPFRSFMVVYAMLKSTQHVGIFQELCRISLFGHHYAEMQVFCFVQILKSVYNGRPGANNEQGHDNATVHKPDDMVVNAK